MKEVIKYVADDGWTFDKKESCLEHEKFCKSKVEADKMFSEKFHKLNDIDLIVVRAALTDFVDDFQDIEAYWFEAYDGWKDTLKSKFADIKRTGVHMEYASVGDDLDKGSIYVFLRSWSDNTSCVFAPGILLGKFTAACYELGGVLTKEVEKVLGR